MDRQGQVDHAVGSNTLACTYAREVAGDETLVAGTICQCPAFEAYQAGNATIEEVAEQACWSSDTTTIQYTCVTSLW